MILGLGIVAVGLRLGRLWLPGYRWLSGGDELVYIQLSQGFLRGCGFARFLGTRCAPPEILRVPGYPFFLAMCNSAALAAVSQAILGGLTTVVIGIVALQFWGVETALLAMLFAALDLPSIVLATMPWTEVIFTAIVTPAFALQLYSLDSKSRHYSIYIMVASCLLGVAALIRPAGQIFLLQVIAAALMLDRSVYRRGILAIGSVVLVALPSAIWSVRNYKLAGLFGSSMTGQFTLYEVYGTDILSSLKLHTTRDTVEREAAIDKVGRQLGRELYDACCYDGRCRGLEHQFDWSERDPLPATLPASCVREMQRRGLWLVAGHPLVFLALAVRHAIQNMMSRDKELVVGLFAPASLAKLDKAGPLPTERLLSAFGRRRGFELALAAESALLTLLWVGVFLAVMSLYDASKSDRKIVLLATSTVLFYICVSATVSASARFRIPVAPLLALASGWGWKNAGQLSLAWATSRKVRSSPSQSTVQSESDEK